MWVTKERLRFHNACDEGMKWFNKNFPDGGDLHEVIGEMIWDVSDDSLCENDVCWVLDRFSSNAHRREIYITKGGNHKYSIYLWHGFYYNYRLGHWNFVRDETKEWAFNKAVDTYELILKKLLKELI